jgi:hypothetical protein
VWNWVDHLILFFYPSNCCLFANHCLVSAQSVYGIIMIYNVGCFWLDSQELLWFENGTGASFINLSCLPALINSPCLYKLFKLSDISNQSSYAQVRVSFWITWISICLFVFQFLLCCILSFMKFKSYYTKTFHKLSSQVATDILFVVFPFYCITI